MERWLILMCLGLTAAPLHAAELCGSACALTLEFNTPGVIETSQGASISFSPGGQLRLGEGGSMTLGEGGVSAPAGSADFSGGGTLTLGRSGRIQFGAGGLLKTGDGGQISLPENSELNVLDAHTVNLDSPRSVHFDTAEAGSIEIHSGSTMSDSGPAPIHFTNSAEASSTVVVNAGEAAHFRIITAHGPGGSSSYDSASSGCGSGSGGSLTISSSGAPVCDSSGGSSETISPGSMEVGMVTIEEIRPAGGGSLGFSLLAVLLLAGRRKRPA